MFAAFARYKREAYRHSEFAPKILNDAGIKVVMKVGFTFWTNAGIEIKMTLFVF